MINCNWCASLDIAYILALKNNLVGRLGYLKNHRVFGRLHFIVIFFHWLVLFAPQFRVEAARLGDETEMISLLSDSPVLQHQDNVRVNDGRETMRDRYRCTVLRDTFQRLQDFLKRPEHNLITCATKSKPSVLFYSHGKHNCTRNQID